MSCIYLTHIQCLFFKDDRVGFGWFFFATSFYHILIIFTSNKPEVFFPLHFLKQGDFMHHLAALCKQFVLEFPETQRVIYIANCNTFFCAKAPLDFTNRCLFFFFFFGINSCWRQEQRCRAGKICQLLLELEAKYRYHTHCWLKLINLLGFCDAVPKFQLPSDKVDAQNIPVF